SRALLPWLRKHGGEYDRVVANGIWQYLSLAAWRRYAGSSSAYYGFPHGMLDPWFRETFALKHLKKCLYSRCAGYRSFSRGALCYWAPVPTVRRVWQLEWSGPDRLILAW